MLQLTCSQTIETLDLRDTEATDTDTALLAAIPSLRALQLGPRGAKASTAIAMLRTSNLFVLHLCATETDDTSLLSFSSISTLASWNWPSWTR
jgi:hypothetical protein